MKKYLVILFAAIFALSLVPTALFAASAETVSDSHGFEYTLSEDGTYYIVTDYDGKLDVVVPAEFNGLPVKEIDGYAFHNGFNVGSMITSISIPDSITRIGSDAFHNCDRLQYNEYGGAKYLGNANNPYVALVGVVSTDITSCTVHEDAKTITSYAFGNCSELTKVELGDSITNIGEGAFANCTALTSIEIPTSVTSIDRFAFYCCSSLTDVEIPDSITSISYGTFQQCTNFESVEIPDSVTNIDGYAFADCSALTNIEIPDSVTSIGVWAFADCSALTDIEVPDSVTSIGSYAFYNTALTEIFIPDSVTLIESRVFYFCDDLTDIYCEAESKPDGWSEFWHTIGWEEETQTHTYPMVHWGCKMTDATSALGNIDGDGDVDAADYVLVKRAVLKTYALSEEQTKVADIDKDGDVDATDYVLIKRIVLGTYAI